MTLPSESISEPIPDDYFDFGLFLQFLSRYKLLILSASLSGLVFGFLYQLSLKSVYQAEFQILLETQNDSASASLLADNPALASLAGLTGSSTNDAISTEIQILKSSSVLRPVFDFVRKHKSPVEASDMRFHEWVSTNVSALEEKGTTVLNVKYRDTDKSLVLPTANLISSTYQDYSNKNRRTELSNVVSYLKEQISIVKPQSLNSGRLALQFGYEHGLGINDGLPLAGNVSGASISLDGPQSSSSVAAMGSSVEAARTAAQQKVKSLEVQISQAKNAGAGSLYFASQIASLTDKSSTFDQLTTLETRLAELRSRLKDNDPLVQKLQRERAALIAYINVQTLALLEGELDLARANLTSLDRPNDIVSTHRELTQTALRNEATLVSLQNQLNQFQLEQARISTPWSLISIPTLRERPVSPRRGRTILFGMLVGTFFGVGIGLFNDSRVKRIYNVNKLKRFLPGSLLETLYSSHNFEQDWYLSIKLLAEGPLSCYISIGLLTVGNIPDNDIDLFSSILRDSLGSNKKLVVSNSLSVTSACDVQILVVSPGSATLHDLVILKEQLLLQSATNLGWILLNQHS